MMKLVRAVPQCCSNSDYPLHYQYTQDGLDNENKIESGHKSIKNTRMGSCYLRCATRTTLQWVHIGYTTLAPWGTCKESPHKCKRLFC